MKANLSWKRQKNLHDESVGEDPCAKEAFAASWGCLEKFMKRNCLSLRGWTTAAEKYPSCVIKKIVA